MFNQFYKHYFLIILFICWFGLHVSYVVFYGIILSPETFLKRLESWRSWRCWTWVTIILVDHSHLILAIISPWQSCELLFQPFNIITWFSCSLLTPSSDHYCSLLDNNEFLGSISPEIYELKMLSEYQVDENQLSSAASGPTCKSRSISG